MLGMTACPDFSTHIALCPQGERTFGSPSDPDILEISAVYPAQVRCARHHLPFDMHTHAIRLRRAELALYMFMFWVCAGGLYVRQPAAHHALSKNC